MNTYDTTVMGSGIHGLKTGAIFAWPTRRHAHGAQRAKRAPKTTLCGNHAPSACDEDRV